MPLMIAPDQAQRIARDAMRGRTEAVEVVRQHWRLAHGGSQRRLQDAFDVWRLFDAFRGVSFSKVTHDDAVNWSTKVGRESAHGTRRASPYEHGGALCICGVCAGRTR